MGVDQIEARLAAGKVTMKILQDMAFDNHVFAARLARHDLMPVCAGDDAPVTIGDRAVSLAQACETLRDRSEEHTSELQSLMRISYAVFCLNKKHNTNTYDK